MAGIVGTIVTVKDYLSPKEVKLVVQPKQPNHLSFHYKLSPPYVITKRGYNGYSTIKYLIK